MTSWGESTNTSWGETDVPSDYGYLEVKKPPKWPLAVQVFLILFSAFLYFAGPLLFAFSFTYLLLFLHSENKLLNIFG